MAEGAENALSGLGTRALRAGRVLVSTQLAAAEREARADAQRIGGGVVVLCVAAVFALAAALSLHAAAVAYVQARFGMSLSLSLLAVAGADALVALALALIGRAKLAAPVMVETRAMVKRTADALRGD